LYDTLSRPFGTRRRVADTQAIDGALAVAISHLRPELLAVARYLVSSEEDAQDLAQRTIELALRHRRALRESAKLRAWLLAIEAREVSRWRRRLRHPIRLDSSVRDISMPAPSLDASIAVRLAVEELPPKTKRAVVLHYMAGLSVAETARALGVGDNTVKTQLRIGLSKLREELTREE
jgi:RNA polymerase sigma-70 factor (ECF subfamily)